jgi:anti-sigma B factor antagonist
LSHVPWQENFEVDLTLATRELDSATGVAVGGEIDVYTAPKLRDKITELVARGHYDIVVDLEAVEFLDSTGLGVLVGGLKKVRQHDGMLRLGNSWLDIRTVEERTKIRIKYLRALENEDWEVLPAGRLFGVLAMNVS